MDNKADVKAIMARFQAGGTNGTEGGSPSHHVGRPKTGLHPTLSSGPPLQPKKPVLESLSGSAVPIPPKPTFLKSSISTKSAPEVREPPNAKALASRFANDQEESNSKPLFPKKPFKPPLSQDTEGKSPVPKLPLHKPSLSSTLPESKPSFVKPSPGLPSNSKPPWVKDDAFGSPPIPSPIPLKLSPSQQKPSSAIAKPQNDEVGGTNTDAATRPFHSPNPTPKPSSNFRTAQSAFNKDKSTDQSEEGSKGDGANKFSLCASNSTPPPMPPVSKKPSFLRRQVGPSSQTNSISGEDPLVPKRNPLPNTLALGPAPSKPNRPPRVDLERFSRGAETTTDGPGPFKKTVVPPPPASHPSNHSNHVTPPLPPAPSLPPRPPGAIIQPDPDENYDDVGLMNNAPPPLPPSSGHPSQRVELLQEDGSDDEMYEDLDDRWDAAEEQEKKRAKEEKDKKEKKEQKERGKKEQEARKKFKLMGPLEVVHRVKARADSRGSKTELSLKQGDNVDIIRVQGNPEGKWLGRSTDGSYGYVKTDSVEIDFDSLKRHRGTLPPQDDYDPEVYDDIDVVPHDNFNSGIQGRPVVLPPPPEEDGEIYDDLIDPSLDVSPSSPPDLKCPPKAPPKPSSFLRMFERRKPPACTNEVPPPSQFTEGNSDQSVSAIDEDIYDDVDSQGFPPPPPSSSLPTLRDQTKAEEIDPKRQKKFEKEEKDFRKKFKYEGEIQVLYEVSIVPNMTNKRWSGKDLPIKPGETLDVIVKAVNNKLICRNDEGKFGYVSTSYVAEDADIYDDIGGDGYIYDND